MELNKDTSKVLVIDDEPLILMANEIMLEIMPRKFLQQVTALRL